MIVVVNGAVVVSKASRTWKDGEVSYSALVSAGDGTKPLEVSIETFAEFEKLKELDVKYDMEINVESSGYKRYATLFNVKAR